MLIQVDARLTNGLANLQGDVRANGHTTGNAARLDALLGDCRELDPDGQHWVRAICLSAYSLLTAGKISEQRNRALLHELARAADLNHPESMAARWILGRTKLALAALGNMKEPSRALLIKEALARFDAVMAVALKHPMLLPGVAVEYPSSLFIDYDPRDIDPLVGKVFSPLRYRIATAAALVDCKPQVSASLLGRAMADSIELRKLHPEGVVTHLNGDVALVFSAALGISSGKQEPSIRAIGDRLLQRIGDVGHSHGVGSRKLLEWQAAVHAVNAIHSETEIEMAREFTGMERDLMSLFHNHYRKRLPDFVWVDAVYFRAFEKVMRRGRQDYDEFLRGLMPRVD